MPALSITLNDERIVTVASDGLDLIDVTVGGDRLGPERAVLRVSGGSFDDTTERRFLTWVPEREIKVGDSLKITFDFEGASSRPGQTIEELYPEELDKPSPPFQPVNEVVRELMQRPKLFESLGFRIGLPDGTVTEGRTTPEEHGFGFSVSWASHRSTHARVSLHTYTLPGLVDKRPLTYHADCKLPPGEGVTFNVVA
ncbi:MAG TPA: hypothetical protein PKH05_16715 [Nitrospira sp.]|nr:hypothetical protein [Nitrospira sp.]